MSQGLNDVMLRFLISLTPRFSEVARVAIGRGSRFNGFQSKTVETVS